MESVIRTSYRAAGVDTHQEEASLHVLGRWIAKTFEFRKGKQGDVQLPLGYFANVIDMGRGVGLAVSTDGVGTKILIAQMMDKYDTVGIDCVAMNANDVICVGAEPLAMLDYLAVESADPDMLEKVAEGLHRGAELANITIPGGEIAQVRDMIKGTDKGWAFDLVGTCVGVVPLSQILIGQEIQEGDIVVGLRSSGIHSNGLTLARRALFEQGGLDVYRRMQDLGRTLGEELLEPTRIYVRECVEMLQQGLAIKAFCHITSDGFLNLTRVAAKVGYRLDSLPEPHPIFQLIQRYGEVSDEEMFRVYNMGIGLCVVVASNDVGAVQLIAKKHGTESMVIGSAIRDDQQEVKIPSRGLVGRNGEFFKD
jgi:phosphoribosylformylglycinamidine cyclo-ligase